MLVGRWPPPYIYVYIVCSQFSLLPKKYPVLYNVELVLEKVTEGVYRILRTERLPSLIRFLDDVEDILELRGCSTFVCDN